MLQQIFQRKPTQFRKQSIQWVFYQFLTSVDRLGNRRQRCMDCPRKKTVFWTLDPNQGYPGTRNSGWKSRSISNLSTLLLNPLQFPVTYSHKNIFEENCPSSN